ncbi:hypothetical protein EVAR_30566_1 [Eumeta japonica]|uniref:Uncharacterized protein n=1 Tax=Eumeta variegata TaxID=151549 RepID=A0A4C1VQ83_EUMVA|nr:hypothetical protein EVAR_30566_1 [Eumeta japonica]
MCPFLSNEYITRDGELNRERDQHQNRDQDSDRGIQDEGIHFVVEAGGAADKSFLRGYPSLLQVPDNEKDPRLWVNIDRARTHGRVVNTCKRVLQSQDPAVGLHPSIAIANMTQDTLLDVQGSAGREKTQTVET